MLDVKGWALLLRSRGTPAVIAAGLVVALLLASPAASSPWGSFGPNRKALTDLGLSRDNIAFAVAIQTDGKPVAAGESAHDFALARYTTQGRLDPSFGRGGKVLTHFPAHIPGALAHAVAIQADGKLVAAGQRGYPSDFALVRYTRNGNLDPTFGHDGKLVTGFGPRSQDGARAAAIQANGKIVLAGFRPFALARYTADGRLDPSFGSAARC
jgi:uncharacterized delta-60 repeat protein